MKTLGIVLYNDDAHLGALFDKTLTINRGEEVENCDAILLHGGTDIASGLYGELPHPRNQNRSGKPSHRDNVEMDCVSAAVRKGIPIFGICRGLQLLCALDGGTLIQDLPSSFNGETDMVTFTGEVKSCPVSHHQAVVVRPGRTEVLAWQKETMLPYAVRFKKMNAFAVQGHPEWAYKDSSFVQFWIEQCKGMLK